MKPHHARPRIGGFTALELLVTLVTVALVAGFIFLPSLATTNCKASRISCVSNLKQIGLAFRMWSNDHGEQFPWNVTSEGTNGGTQEFALTSEVWRHFQAISNELNTPKVLACGDDKERQRTASWDSLTNNSHLSYFIGLNANEIYPQAILTGDRNLAVSNKLLKGVVTLTPDTNPEWTTAIHNKSGNLGLADGSASQATTPMSNKQLQAAFLSTTQATLRFVFPQ